ncbi:hypothetical protein [Rhizobium ruizarguesonis]|jgi:hypothetical protein|uniref:hypothetical protein n=1 Tax=Rhizobium ruizarguesonis TaxID=2081791 RepID=UPI00103189A1|nr:hypothetical protein [Rhizobium ruizarguesonis]TBA24758.1 hypothetical protein ELH61_02600 [Rhizobium ruizarguesonis]
MADRFPKGFDAHQHGLLRTLYGDLVPPLESIRVRVGWYRLVDQMFARFGRLRDRRNLRVLAIETRYAGHLVVRIDGIATDVPEIVYDAEEAARHTCEHCSKPARMIVKVGLESLLASTDVELGDRLLCTDCAHLFQKEIADDYR